MTILELFPNRSFYKETFTRAFLKNISYNCNKMFKEKTLIEVDKVIMMLF